MEERINKLESNQNVITLVLAISLIANIFLTIMILMIWLLVIIS